MVTNEGPVSDIPREERVRGGDMLGKSFAIVGNCHPDLVGEPRVTFKYPLHPFFGGFEDLAKRTVIVDVKMNLDYRSCSQTGTEKEVHYYKRRQPAKTLLTPS